MYLGVYCMFFLYHSLMNKVAQKGTISSVRTFTFALLTYFIPDVPSTNMSNTRNYAKEPIRFDTEATGEPSEATQISWRDDASATASVHYIRSTAKTSNHN